MTTVAISGADGWLAVPARRRLAAEPDLDLADLVADPAELGQGEALDAVVHVSTMLVYGAHPDNPVPLTEQHPVRPVEGYPIAEEAAQRERAVDAWQADHPGVPVAVLRPAMPVGEDVPSLLLDTFVGGRVLGVRGHRPPLQFLHVDDLLDAIVHAARQRLSGPHNVASEGWLSADDVEAILGRRRLDVPEEVVFSSTERLRVAGLSPLPTGAVHHLMHPWVADVSRLVETGWRPRHANRDVLAELADRHGDRVVVGPVTTTRHEVRQAAGIAAGLTGGMLALGLVARRRRRGDGEDEG